MSSSVAVQGQTNVLCSGCQITLATATGMVVNQKKRSKIGGERELWSSREEQNGDGGINGAKEEETEGKKLRKMLK